MLRPIHSSDRQIDHVKVVLPSFLPPPAVSDIPLQQLCKRVAENIVELGGLPLFPHHPRANRLLITHNLPPHRRLSSNWATRRPESLKHRVQYLLEIGRSFALRDNIPEILRHLLQEPLLNC